MNEGGDFDKLGRGHVWDGSIDPCIHQNHVFAVRPFGVSPQWLNLVTGSAYAQFHFMSRSKQSTNLASISSTNVMELPVVLPPAKEQAAITGFLALEVAKIDTLISEQQRLIALLSEKRQAIVAQAVTKGLNAAAPTKDSGVHWLSKGPTHWKVVRLGQLSISRCDGPFGSGLKSEHYTDSGVRVVRLQNIRSEGFNGQSVAYIDSDYYSEHLGDHDVRTGDLLIAGLGDERNTVGRACVAPDGIEPAMVKADCFRFRLDGAAALPTFVAFALNASAAADAGYLAGGSTRSRIPLSIMASRQVPLPPIEEQARIASMLSRTVSEVDRLCAEAEHAIALLRERRTALISAAVTGQIDVRQPSPAESTPAAHLQTHD
jgi:type I restriction enzyme, S subunit